MRETRFDGLTLHESYGDEVTETVLAGDQAFRLELPNIATRGMGGQSESTVSLFLGLDGSPDVNPLFTR